MDDILANQILKQIRFLNRWIKFMTVLLLLTVVVAGIVVYQAISYVHSAIKKVDNLQQQASQTLNIKQQVCSNANIGTLLKKDSNVCN
jgi:cell division protein YceG involved in septum cleavage